MKVDLKYVCWPAACVLAIIIFQQPLSELIQRGNLSVSKDELTIVAPAGAGGKGGNSGADSGGKAIGGEGGPGGTIGPGGGGGDAYAAGMGSPAIRGIGGRGGAGVGGRAGDAKMTGVGVAMGGEGGEAGQPDGRGGRGGRSPAEILGLPPGLLAYGRGGNGGNSPEYNARLAVIEKLRHEYIDAHPSTSEGFSASKRLTENELSDFSLLWHDGCD